MALLRDANIDILDGDARTPLMYASLEGQLGLVTWLLSNGAGIDIQDRNGHTALHFAVQEGHMDIALCLLDHGAAIDAKDIHGNTPLWRATFEARGTYELVQLLMAHGADPASRNESGRSPLEFATQIRDQELVAILTGG